jgi:hypothetical protein
VECPVVEAGGNREVRESGTMEALITAITRKPLMVVFPLPTFGLEAA